MIVQTPGFLVFLLYHRFGADESQIDFLEQPLLTQLYRYGSTVNKAWQQMLRKTHYHVLPRTLRHLPYLINVLSKKTVGKDQSSNPQTCNGETCLIPLWKHRVIVWNTLLPIQWKRNISFVFPPRVSVVKPGLTVFHYIEKANDCSLVLSLRDKWGGILRCSSSWLSSEEEQTV